MATVAPFATIQTGINTGVMSLLADTVGFLDGVEVVGQLDAGYQGASMDGFGTAGTSPQFHMLTADLPAIDTNGLPFVIPSGPSAGRYSVGLAYPDGTGWVTLHLLLQSTY